MAFLKKIVSCFVIVPVLLCGVFQGAAFSGPESNSIWLGSQFSSPGRDEIRSGVVFYDIRYGKIKKCLDEEGEEWEDFPGGCRYSKFAVVAETGKADFTVEKHGAAAIQEAIDSLDFATDNNRCAVIILPGEYDIGNKSLVCRPFVDLIGIDRYDCKITGNSGCIIRASNQMGIINLSVNNTRESKGAVGILLKGKNNYMFMDGCRVSSYGAGVECSKKAGIYINKCKIVSSNRYGLLCRGKSSAGVYSSLLRGGRKDLSCAGKSYVLVSIPDIVEISLSGKSAIEIDDTGGKNFTINGKPGCEVLADSLDIGIAVGPGLKVVPPGKSRFRERPVFSYGCKQKTDEVETISLKEVRRKLKKKKSSLILIDVRSRKIFNVKHIKNAISIPEKEIRDRIHEIPKYREVVMYCSSEHCGLSYSAARILKSLGINDVKEMKEGIAGWEDHGYPVVKGKK